VSAPTYALIAGLVYIASAIFGLVESFTATKIFCLAYFLVGAWGIGAWIGASNALRFARSVAVLFALLALLQLVPSVRALFRLMPLDGNDLWLHLATALSGAYIGWRSLFMPMLRTQLRPGTLERRHPPGNRRGAVRPIAYERRHGSYDRRRARYGGSNLAAG
jgi:hypothetical protein